MSLLVVVDGFSSKLEVCKTSSLVSAMSSNYFPCDAYFLPYDVLYYPSTVYKIYSIEGFQLTNVNLKLTVPMQCTAR